MLRTKKDDQDQEQERRRERDGEDYARVGQHFPSLPRAHGRARKTATAGPVMDYL